MLKGSCYQSILCRAFITLIFSILSGLRGGKPKKKAEFTVDTRDAGYGGLGLSVEGPSKVEINCVDNEDGTCSVDFTPSEPGQYLINVTYADVHVPGSPFKCRVGDGPVG